MRFKYLFSGMLLLLSATTLYAVEPSVGNTLPELAGRKKASSAIMRAFKSDARNATNELGTEYLGRQLGLIAPLHIA